MSKKPKDRFTATVQRHIDTYINADQTAVQRLADVRQEIKNLKAMARRPRQSAEQLELLINLRRSAQAEEKLIQKHLDWVANGRPLFHKLGHHDHSPERHQAVVALHAADNAQRAADGLPAVFPNHKAFEHFNDQPNRQD